MNIFFDGRTIREGKTGVGVYAYNILTKLSEKDHANSYKAFVLEPLPEQIKNLDVIQTSISYEDHPLGDIWETFFLPFYLYAKQADIFFSPTFHLPFFTYKTKAIATIHDLAMFRYPQTVSRLFRMYGKMLIRASLSRADAVIVPSSSTKKDILNMFTTEEKKIHVISLAAGKNFYPVTKDEILHQVRKKYTLPDRYILFVGAIEPRKNISGLIKAFNDSKKNGENRHKLVICGGEGWLGETKKLRQLVTSFGIEKDVLFIGYVPNNDLPALYSMADLFVFPSLYEGFGIPILEAMATGCPVIASSTSSLPEIAGDAALLVDPLDTKGLSRSLSSVLTDEQLCLRMRETGLKQAQKFSWERAAKEIVEMYQYL